MISVCIVPEGSRDELLTRNPLHRSKNVFVTNTSCAKLFLHHGMACNLKSRIVDSSAHRKTAGSAFTLPQAHVERQDPVLIANRNE